MAVNRTMMTAGCLAVLTCLLIFSACKKSIEEPSDALSLTGNVAGLKESTFIFLDVGDHTDSTIVSGGRFTFKRKLPASPVRGLIKTRDLKDYKFIWLENKEMTFTARIGHFRDAKVTGSQTNDQYNAYDSAISPLIGKLDSLRRLMLDTSIDKTLSVKARQQADALMPDLVALQSKYIRKYSASVLGAFILNFAKESLHRDTLSSLLAALSPSLSDTKDYLDIARFDSLNADVSIGNKAVNFVQNDTSGHSVSLSHHKGKIVLLEFWASWCGPCRKQNPELVASYRRFRNRGFEIIGISLDTKKSNWVKAIRSDSLTWVHVSECNGNANTAAMIYGVTDIPDNFLIDRNGVIVARNLRSGELDATLEKLMDSAK